MAYNRENYIKLKKEYEDKNLAAKRAADARTLEVSIAHPDIAEIDRELSMTGIKILGAACSGAEGLEALKARVSELRQKKMRLLSEYGYDAAYCDVKYECCECADTGYVGTAMCKCFKRALILAGYESSGIGALIKKQTFDNFSFEYYADDKKTLSTMQANYNTLKSYAENFTLENSRSLLLIGGTGIGKTHLSSAVAKTVIERGYDVLYESAPNIFFELEQTRFAKDAEGMPGQRYYEAELLIIDDLGTESITQYSVACLYNILNTRINRGLCTIINTNLMPDALYTKYTDRIASRLLGEFSPLHFVGRDIRMQKLKKSF